jgi:hypothetical protein
MLLAAPLTFVLALLSSSAIATSVSLERRSPITIYHGTCKEHVDDIKKGLKLADGPFPGDFTYKAAFYCTDNHAQAQTYSEDFKTCSQGHAVVEFHFDPTGLQVLNLGAGKDDNSPAVKFFHACQKLALKLNSHEALDAADKATKAEVDKYDVIEGSVPLSLLIVQTKLKDPFKQIVFLTAKSLKALTISKVT